MDPAIFQPMSIGEAHFRQRIPLLHPRTRIQDLDVLKAWYEAVADALRPELPSTRWRPTLRRHFAAVVTEPVS